MTSFDAAPFFVCGILLASEFFTPDPNLLGSALYFDDIERRGLDKVILVTLQIQRLQPGDSACLVEVVDKAPFDLPRSLPVRVVAEGVVVPAV